MGYGDHRALILLQMLLEPVYRLGIEVVCRLVEQQYVRLLQEQAAQRHTSALAAGEVCYSPVAGRTSQCVHCTLKL